MRNQITSTAITLLLFFVLLFLYTKIAGPIPFLINSIATTKSTTFGVTGEGKTTIKPDSASVLAGISATGSTVEQVQNQVNSTIAKVSSAIKALGVDAKDIQTSNYNVNPTYDFTSGSQKIIGYSASTNLTIKVRDINKVGNIIDAATANGATNVNNLGFDTTDKTAAEDEARKMAVADAKKKAQDVAGIAGFKLGNIINYSESFNGSSGPQPLFDRAQAMGAPTKIEPGSNEIILTVTLSYEVR